MPLFFWLDKTVYFASNFLKSSIVVFSEYFNLGYKPIFNFIISIINSSKGRNNYTSYLSSRSVSLPDSHFSFRILGRSSAKDGAFYSLNRVILYQLSRQLKELTGRKMAGQVFGFRTMSSFSDRDVSDIKI